MEVAPLQGLFVRPMSRNIFPKYGQKYGTNVPFKDPEDLPLTGHVPEVTAAGDAHGTPGRVSETSQEKRTGCA